MKGAQILKEQHILYSKEELTQEDLKLIKGCLLTTQETFKLVPFKNQSIINKIKQIDEVLQKFGGC